MTEVGLVPGFQNSEKRDKMLPTLIPSEDQSSPAHLSVGLASQDGKASSSAESKTVQVRKCQPDFGEISMAKEVQSQWIEAIEPFWASIDYTR